MSGVKSGVNISLGRQWEAAQCVVEDGWIDLSKGPTVAGRSQLTVDDVVTLDGRFSVWGFMCEELEAGF